MAIAKARHLCIWLPHSGGSRSVRELIRFGADPLLKDKRGLIAPTLAYLLRDDLRLVRAFFHEAARGTRASP